MSKIIKKKRKTPIKRVKKDTIKHERSETKIKEIMEHRFGGHIDAKQKKKQTKKKK